MPTSRSPRMVLGRIDRADFWDRPPEQIHADLQSPLHWPDWLVIQAWNEGQLTPEQQAEIEHPPSIGVPADTKRVTEQLVLLSQTLLEKLPEAERALLKHLPPRVLIQQLLGADSAKKDRLCDAAVVCALQDEGPAALSEPAVQAHLERLWAAMRVGPLSARQAAKERWRFIMLSPLPNLRTVKQRKSPIEAVVTRVEGALQRLAPLLKHRWHSDDRERLLQTLHGRGYFPDWPAKTLEKLADALIAWHSDSIHAAIREGVGSGSGHGHSGVRSALVAARAVAARRQRIVEGKRRYIDWLSRQGLEPSRPAAALLALPE
ncbi:MAG TPA: hypothetical protein VMS64_19225 [Candidatus Methylomirabilis sp.]|nr:hypothetical protein [Candidatus Methylomirabilis sp.]